MLSSRLDSAGDFAGERFGALHAHGRLALAAAMRMGVRRHGHASNCGTDTAMAISAGAPNAN